MDDALSALEPAERETMDVESFTSPRE